MKLRSHLHLMVAGALAPVVLFAVISAGLLVQHERRTIEREAIGRTRAAMSAVDAALLGHITTLKALAASKNLVTGNLQAFHEESQRVMRSQPEWQNIGLATPAKEQLSDAILPYGKHAPFGHDDAAFDEAVRTRQPIIGDVAGESAIRMETVRVRVPMVLGGEVRYVLSAPLKLESLAEILQAQKLPHDWVIALADRHRRIIVRIPSVAPGTPASESFSEAIARAPEGWFRGSTLEGKETYTPYVTSQLSGWVLGIAIPATTVNRGAWRTFALTATGVALALGMALGLAWFIGRRIEAPIASLAKATHAIGRGERLAVPSEAPIDEITRLAQTLQKSVDAMREREDRLRLALDAGRMGSWEWDVHTNRLAWSPELEAIHGLAQHSFAGTFEALLKEVHPEDRERVRAESTAILERGEQHLEYRIVRPDGAIRWVESRAKLVRDSPGTPQRVVGVCMDITGRKQVEEALKETSRAKDEFLAMLSHELRNPLAALSAAAHVLKLAHPNEAPAMKARAVVERQTRHMARLVGDLLDISRLAMGKVALERERFNLAEAVRNVVTVWRSSGRLERHHVTTSIRSAWVDADRARIEQVLSNLLDNAVKFTPAGKRIHVAVEQLGDWAVLSIEDEGEGLLPGSAERMFDLFVQGERGLDRAAGGLGVGLALVKRLTEMHGGTVSASSAGRGHGAAFTVKLPTVLAPAARALEPESDPVLAPRRVLIVEDNDDARLMLHEALAFSGHRVQEARDGATGLALAAQSTPDIALIDIGLPDVDGYEVARLLRASPGGRRMILIAITGYGQTEDQRRAYEAGFDAHLTKPVAPERLKQVMAGLQ
ncbi:MAG TPA: ATP-binding protein [Burkholderiales bacterium]|nr:ATP-binding protein [Burkholderiales bacterium]